MGEKINCTIWDNGSRGWGIRVGSSNNMLHFREDIRSIKVDLDGNFFSFNLTNTFWTSCPEFRGSAIRRWLERHGIDKRNKNDYVIELEIIEPYRKFKATIIKKL